MVSFQPGTVIAHYTIEAQIGAGGMGEVYRAYDSRLERRVALKILPPDVVTNDERLRRFIREAKTTSGLNHPNILTIHEIGETEAVPPPRPDDARATVETAALTRVHYIAMELIRGETLRDKFRKYVDLATLLDYLAQAAEGLARAHDAGVIHRDLKPENLMVTDDGFTKVVDFGLAKLTERQTERIVRPHEAPTAVISQTESGVIVGTVGYMSPEQVQGVELDHRSDIFSFGCILYEAISDRHPFRGDSVIDTLHRIVYQEPPPVDEDLEGECPEELQAIVRRCLAKKPSQRYDSARELAADLREARIVVSRSFRKTDLSRPRKRVRPRRPLWPIVIAAGVVALVVALFLIPRTREKNASPNEQTARVERPPMTLTRITDDGDVLDSAISSDGRYVVYARGDLSGQSLWLRQVAAGTSAQLIPASPVRYHGLGFSTDGNYVEYSTHEPTGATEHRGGLFQIPLLGGPSRRITDAVEHSSFARSPSGKSFLHVRNDTSGEEQLVLRNESGKELVIARTKGRFAAHGWADSDERIVFAEREKGVTRLIILPLAAAAERQVLGEWSRINTVAWHGKRSAIVVAGQKTDEEAMQLWSVSASDGSAERLTNDLFGYRDVSVSSDGNSIVAIQDQQYSNLWISDLDGKNARALTSGAATYDDISVARDGVFYSRHNGNNREIFRFDPASSTSRQITFEPKSDVDPFVCAAANAVVFLSNRAGEPTVWRMELDGSSPRQVTTRASDNPACSPDGQHVYFTIYENAAGVWRAPMNGGAPTRFGEKVMNFATVSPDGSWIGSAYWEKTGTKTRIAITPASGGPAKKIFELAPGAIQPLRHLRWTPDGRELAYLAREPDGTSIWTQPISGGEPRRLLSLGPDEVFSFDWSPDGKGVVFTRGRSTSDAVLLQSLVR